MSERPVRIRFDYTQELVRKRCRIPQTEHFFEFTDVGIREVDANEAPVAYRVSRLADNADTSTYVIRAYDGGWWWPVGGWPKPPTPDEFVSMADKGNKSVVGALGAPTLHARQTIDEFERRYPIRRLGNSSKEERELSLKYGSARTLFCDGRVFFEAGPPAFFRGPTSNKMVVGACGLGPDQFGNDGHRDCYIAGLARHLRRDSAATGQALGPGEIDTFREGMPGWSLLAEVQQRIEIFPGAAPPGAASLFCEREFPDKIRSLFRNPIDFERKELLRSHDPQLWDWVQSDCHAFDRQILRRFAEASEPEFSESFRGQIKAARAILGRLKYHGLATELDEADETAFATLATF